MKLTFMVTKYTKKDLELVKTIIANEEIEATAYVGRDAYGTAWVKVEVTGENEADVREQYRDLKQVYNMVTGSTEAFQFNVVFN